MEFLEPKSCYQGCSFSNNYKNGVTLGTLKQVYLLPFNRPRLNLLVHIIDTKLLMKFINDFEAFKTGVDKPYWWKQFVITWNDCASCLVRHIYDTNSVIFTCPCSAWLRIQFFLYKHLIQNRKCSFYHQVTLNRVKPFIVINEDSV